MLVSLCTLLHGCVTVPPGGFVTESRLPTPQVIEIFRQCYAGARNVVNKFGNGSGVAFVSDPTTNTARLEIFAVTFDERAAQDSFWGRGLNHEVVISAVPFGSRVEVKGNATTAAMNATHQTMGQILRGELRCEERMR